MDRRVLVLEEDPGVAERIATILGRDGFEVFLTDDARVGLSMARQERLDLVIVSAQIDPIGGFQFCRLLKRHRSTEKIPVIITSQRAHRRCRRRSVLVGGAAYIEKPLVESRLVDAVYENLLIAEESTCMGPDRDFIFRDFGLEK